MSQTVVFSQGMLEALAVMRSDDAWEAIEAAAPQPRLKVEGEAAMAAARQKLIGELDALPRDSLAHVFAGFLRTVDGFAAFAAQSELACAELDLVRGHDYLKNDLFLAVVRAVQQGRVVGILFGTPCSSFSEARHNKSDDPRYACCKPLRLNRANLVDRSGLSPKERAEAGICRPSVCAALEHSRNLLGTFPQVAMHDELRYYCGPDRVALNLHPEVVALIAATGAKILHVAQCRFGGKFQKVTMLIVSPRVYEALKSKGITQENQLYQCWWQPDKGCHLRASLGRPAGAISRRRRRLPAAAVATAAAASAASARFCAGKTKTMVARAEHLCSAGTSCMLLVFARKAAEELRRRLCARRLSGVEVLTLHKWALSLLRRRMPLRVLPEAEAKALTVVAASKVAPRPPQVKDGDILALLQRAERRPATIPPDDWLLRVREMFDRLCTSAGAVLLGAVFRLAAELLQRDGRLLAEVQSEVRHVLVDEAQDLDAAQLALLELLRAGSSPVGITAVGDPRQAIFGWRGAAPGTIVAFADAVLGSTQESAVKAHRDGGEAVELHAAKTPDAEMALIAKLVQSLHTDGAPFDHIAILFRTNAPARSLEEYLQKESIPVSRLTAPEASARTCCAALLSLLRLVSDENDNAAFLAVLCAAPDRSRPRADDLSALEKEASSRSISFWDAVGDGGLALEISTARLLVNKLQTALQTQRPSELLHNAVYQAQQRKPIVDNQGRYELRQHEGEAEGDVPPKELLATFLEKVAEEEERRGAGGGVEVTTMHAAKGREWRCVIVANLTEGQMPLAEADEEEERRLLYVACTRAKDRLVLTHPRSEQLSRFLSADREGNDILLCDWRGCKAGWHMQCLSPPLREVPEGQWLCPAHDPRRASSLPARPAKRPRLATGAGSSSGAGSSAGAVASAANSATSQSSDGPCASVPSPPQSLLHQRVRVWWSEERKWFSGKVVNYRAVLERRTRRARHRYSVKYDDGDSREHFLGNDEPEFESWQILP
ncbi:hypothetical protein EMIHUDRAFT_209166 [Emiliania huxleyi CCMP1516]|uniref:DNA 3'-5' helicase n=2 Tax=Emiliania huxleyi TaxID=2903 RepID=A0A0D3J7T2_EMIH1|nr:hypothetical protein EMIHUDRAFT_209166 [Emiliania huxleyi CCMP1516]EOD19567.1 hypothetical protein EMIHUDRAFT_209166 [Emiliania huxleyi CCMP1516]|eukprot:XP_005771996.1 hypothetical protein EMIHUDRAFT_209166 [Emiliania huxleyi CCMP1516]